MSEPLPRKLSVLMPVYNEASTVEVIARRVLDAPCGLEVELVCVDDGSTDGTGARLRELAEGDGRVRVLSHERNRGKGAGVRTAIGAMTGDVAVIQDADLEYDPSDYARLLEPILAGEADAVYGSRFLSSGRRQVRRFWHAQANRLLTFCCNAVSDLSLTDMETCYKMVRADVLRGLTLTADRFDIEVELTMRLSRWRGPDGRAARMYEVPISYLGRTRAEGKKIGARDGVEALWAIARFGLLGS
ncbi:MAG: glycosyltransferase family 2 protein [Planctomycetota bacterium]